MPRIRTVKPEFFTHPEVVEVSIPARLLLVSLWTQADDEGRLYDQPWRIGANTFAETDRVNIGRLLDELDDSGRIVRYEAEGKRLVQIVNFTKHQTVSHPRPSSHPPPGTLPERSLKVPGKLPEASSQEWKGMEGNGMELLPAAGTLPERVPAAVGAVALPTAPLKEPKAAGQYPKDRPENEMTPAERRAYRTDIKNHLLIVCSLEPQWMTKSAWGRVEAAAKELAELEVDPADIDGFKRWWERKHPGIQITPQTVVTHWPAYAGGAA